MGELGLGLGGLDGVVCVVVGSLLVLLGVDGCIAIAKTANCCTRASIHVVLRISPPPTPCPPPPARTLLLQSKPASKASSSSASVWYGADRPLWLGPFSAGSVPSVSGGGGGQAGRRGAGGCFRGITQNRRSRSFVAIPSIPHPTHPLCVLTCAHACST